MTQSEIQLFLKDGTTEVRLKRSPAIPNSESNPSTSFEQLMHEHLNALRVKNYSECCVLRWAT